MSNFILTPNMSLTVPITGVTVGPDWANEVNASLVLIDNHNHAQGSGVAITPAGLNINSDFPLQGNNLTLVRTVRFQVPSIQPASASDLLCLYSFGQDLYYRDGAGNQVRITQGGSITGAAGNITNLTSPASVTYVSGTTTFVFQAAANTAGNLDAGAVILRNLTASSKGLTLSPPSAMAADYTITLPALPLSATSILSISTGGAMGIIVPDNATIENSGGTLQVKAKGIGNAQIADGLGLIPSGSMLPFGGAAAPSGYLLCDGTSYLRATYPNLYSAIGNAYGTVDGTHFNVPDFRGLFLRGVTGSSSNDPNASTRTASNPGGNAGNNVGSLQQDQVGPHTHTMSGGAVGSGTSGSPQHVVQSDALGLTMTTNSNATSETRPLNIYVQYLIKT